MELACTLKETNLGKRGWECLFDAGTVGVEGFFFGFVSYTFCQIDMLCYYAYDLFCFSLYVLFFFARKLCSFCLA